MDNPYIVRGDETSTEAISKFLLLPGYGIALYMQLSDRVERTLNDRPEWMVYAEGAICEVMKCAGEGGLAFCIYEIINNLQ